MSEAFNLITIAQSNDTADGVNAVAKSIGGLTSEVRQRRNGTPILEVLSGANSDILLIELDLADASAVRELERIAQSRGPDAATLVTSANASIQDIRSLLRLGIQDYIPQPISKDDLVTTLKRRSPNLANQRALVMLSMARSFRFSGPAAALEPRPLLSSLRPILTVLRRSEATDTLSGSWILIYNTAMLICQWTWCQTHLFLT